MALDIAQIEYFTITVGDEISSASGLLSAIAEAGGDFHAFKSIPLQNRQIQFTLFAKDSSKIIDASKKSGLKFDGPNTALFIKGDEKHRALANIYKELSRGGIQVKEACGIADVNSGYGVILYLEKEDCERAKTALQIL